MAAEPRILWADDEIDLLRPHILFLESKGYSVDSVTNGADAVDRVREERYDVVMLDEQMPGMGGLEALTEIKEHSTDMPEVMGNKSEEEHQMEGALGRKNGDYQKKSDIPSQSHQWLTCLAQSHRIR